jgi:hypothetical protein
MSQLRKLATPIADAYIGKSGKGMDAADHTVIRQLLLLYLGPYSWEIDESIYSDMPELQTKNNTYPGGRMVSGCYGRLTAVIDGVSVTVREPGGVERPQMIDGDGERLKHAASDALKRCAMSEGLGLHIWAQQNYFLDRALDKRAEANGDAA